MTDGPGQANPIPAILVALASDLAPLLLPQPLATMLRRGATEALREAGVDPDLLYALSTIRDIAAMIASTLPVATAATIAVLLLQARS